MTGDVAFILSLVRDTRGTSPRAQQPCLLPSRGRWAHFDISELAGAFDRLPPFALGPHDFRFDKKISGSLDSKYLSSKPRYYVVFTLERMTTVHLVRHHHTSLAGISIWRGILVSAARYLRVKEFQTVLLQSGMSRLSFPALKSR